MKAYPVAGLILAGACTASPDRDAVHDEFLQHAPQATVTAVRRLASNGEDAVFRIQYRVPPDTASKAQQWFYQRAADGTWTLAHRDTTGTADWLIPTRPNQHWYQPGAPTR